MHNRLTLCVTALMAAAALGAAPALGQSTAGNSGPAEIAAERGAPMPLPAAMSPKPTPTIDAGAISRGPFGQDLDAALDGLTTTTLSRDGSVTETPASDQLRSIFTEEQKTMGSMGVGEVTADRNVIANDNRVQATDTSVFPERIVGWLLTKDQAGDWATCSATLIGPKTVLTAAHCVYDHPTGGWVTEMYFRPGANGAQDAPYGEFDWDSANVLKGYITNYDGTNYGSVLPWDLAVVTLIEEAGTQLGWMGFRVDDASDFKAEIVGYPGDKPEGTMWIAKCDIPTDNFGDLAFWHECDTYAGSSGSSMFEQAAKDDYYVRGVNVAEDDEVNYGVRLTQSYYDWVVSNYH